MLVKVNKDETTWPSRLRKRGTQPLGLSKGAHIMPTAKWEKLVERAGKARIDEAIENGLIELSEV